MDRVDFLLYWIWMWIIFTTSLVTFDSAGAFDVYVLLFFYALHWCCVLIFICWLLQANVILLLKWLYASCSYKHLNILLKLPLGSPLFSTQLMKRLDSCISNEWDYLNMCYPQPCSFTCKIFYKCWNLAFVYLHFDIPYSTCICSPFFFHLILCNSKSWLTWSRFCMVYNPISWTCTWSFLPLQLALYLLNNKNLHTSYCLSIPCTLY